ncbi:ammonium transporter [Corynebacterium halotolerans]|uniref:Ammonium transporter n=1 Tax=Corynebacterium halotolerans YIM 70093 = DSM 44683 TaxID=1121362 RepID=M1NP06_9CORY|nr:ammonium transporter [Corynebacterium halotolerans]AGF71237.1 high-affinity ammonia permease [Corynebacterium halotolerans YIM 70093 = DSM 44683]
MEAADIAWILAAVALVALMFPGLAFLYGGMLGSGQVLNMFMMVMGSLAVTSVVYVIYGHGLVLGDSVGGLGLIGNPLEFAGFSNLLVNDGSGSLLTAGFYILFAAISLALVASGAAGRMKFGAWLLFGVLWVTLVYAPLAHWVFAFDDPETGTVGGWLVNTVGMHDFAGGTAVHMNAGASGLALALVLGARRSGATRPHNLPLTLIGAGMLMIGWLGFNGGTAGGANFLASYVVVTSILAAAGGMLGFIVVERVRHGRPTLLGLATGLIAGLVGITPAADAVSPVGAIAVGFLAAALAAWAISWKSHHGIDDSLDVFAVHGIAGIAGAFFVMLFGSAAAPAGVQGVLLGGDLSLLWREPLAVAVTLVWSFGLTWLIATAMMKVHDIRISREDEDMGVDRAIHAETAYELRQSTMFGQAARRADADTAADRKAAAPTPGPISSPSVGAADDAPTASTAS